ncbi:MAG: GspE/PulE family protein [Dehalococcoidia bacterium]
MDAGACTEGRSVMVMPGRRRPTAAASHARAAEPATFDWSTLGEGETATSLIPEALAREYKAFPARVEDGKLVLVMANPADYRAIQTLELRARMEVVAYAGTPDDIGNAINIHYSTSMPDAVVTAMDRRYAPTAESLAGVREIPLVHGADNAAGGNVESPAIQAIDSLISQAAKARATDIHIEPMEDRVRVRFRIDGFLQEVARLPRASQGALLSRLKIMAGMDIAERRRPQDGHFAVKVGEDSIEVRAATTDTVHGEMIVLRILNKGIKLFSLDDLGMLEVSTSAMKKLLGAPYGIILVSGPTGAGKTTTLYAALNEMDNQRQNVITIEDPVEYRFPGINSIQINEKAGLSFSGSLRAVLRLDPDVILVGEIRDAETARIAVQAALTGHLVLSSVHANDAVRAVSRMLDLGIEPFLLSSALLGVVSQRMVRRVCDHCARGRLPEGDELASIDELGLDPKAELISGEGCYFCSFTGYRGRTGLYEILTATESFRAMVMRRAGNSELLEAAREHGFFTMKEDGAMKVQKGLTTPFEVLRSVYSL